MWMKKFIVFIKEIFFFKIVVKEKLLVGLMVWLVKLVNVEMIIKW